MYSGGFFRGGHSIIEATETGRAVSFNGSERRSKREASIPIRRSASTGHINPTVLVGAALEARGHEVAWVGHPGVLKTRLPEDAHVFPLDDQVPDAYWRHICQLNAHRFEDCKGFQVFVGGLLDPIGLGELTDVQAAIDDYAPDVVTVDTANAGGCLSLLGSTRT